MLPIRPSSQRTSRMAMIVQSIGFSSTFIEFPLRSPLQAPRERPYRRMRASRASEGSLAPRATILDDLVDQEHGGEQQEEIHPLAETEDHADQPEDECDCSHDPDHGI